jgi:hypothetical protein
MTKHLRNNVRNCGCVNGDNRSSWCAHKCDECKPFEAQGHDVEPAVSGAPLVARPMADIDAAVIPEDVLQKCGDALNLRWTRWVGHMNLDDITRTVLHAADYPALVKRVAELEGLLKQAKSYIKCTRGYDGVLMHQIEQALNGGAGKHE